MNDDMDVDPPHFQQINSEGLCKIDEALLNHLIPPEILLSARTRPALGEYFLSSDGYVSSLVWSSNRGGLLCDDRWREFLGPIKDQGLHLLCWCYASTDLFSAESILSGWEDEYHPLCAWHLCATCCPHLLGTDQAAPQGHLCYGYSVAHALQHIYHNGIPREIRPEFPCSIKPPQSLIIPGERIENLLVLENLEEALFYLRVTPVGADLIYFDGLFDQGSDIYYGPKASNVRFKGYHAVIIESVTQYRGDIVAICKMSNGVEVANEGYVYVSLTTLFMHIGIDSSKRRIVRETARPQHLLSNFVILAMHKRRKREQTKKVEVETEKTEEKDVNEDTEQVKEANKEEEVEADTEVDEPKVEDKQTESKDENENEINDSKDENEDIEEGTKDEKEDEKEESIDDKEDENEDIKKSNKQGEGKTGKARRKTKSEEEKKDIEPRTSFSDCPVRERKSVERLVGYGAHPSSGPGGYGAPQSGHGGGYGAPPPSYGSPFASLVPSAFPPGTDPNIVACFQAADRDNSGFIYDKELQEALSSYHQSFSLRTVHLLMYLFTNSNVKKIGPKEFASLFYSLQNWRSIFERFDKDRSGRIDTNELRDALLSLGFLVSPVILDLLVSKYDKSGGRNRAIEYDNFIECCLTVKGLTEKFMEKDTALSGSATFNYETFMLTILPFHVVDKDSSKEFHVEKGKEMPLKDIPNGYSDQGKHIALS